MSEITARTIPVNIGLAKARFREFDAMLTHFSIKHHLGIQADEITENLFRVNYANFVVSGAEADVKEWLAWFMPFVNDYAPIDSRWVPVRTRVFTTEQRRERINRLTAELQASMDAQPEIYVKCSN